MQLAKLTCPKCNSENQFHQRSRMITCRNCGSSIDTHTNKLFENPITKLKSNCDLSLGIKGKIKNIEIEIVGYILYKQREGLATYYWEEWFAISEKGYHWIQYDISDNRYTFLSKFQPKIPIDIKKIYNNKKFDLGDGEFVRIEESGQAEIIKIAGELPWKAKIGNKINFADGVRGHNRYSVEWSENEVEYFKGSYIYRKALLHGFNMSEKLNKLITSKKLRRKTTIAIWIGVIVSMIGIFASIGEGETIFKENIYLCPENAKNVKCENYKLPLGPIVLKSINRPHNISLTTSSATKTNWPYTEVTLLDENQSPINSFSGDFWVDQGESDKSEDFNFLLTKQGKYYLDLESYKDSIKSTSDLDYFTIEVKQNTILTRYYLIFAIILIIIQMNRFGMFKEN